MLAGGQRPGLHGGGQGEGSGGSAGFCAFCTLRRLHGQMLNEQGLPLRQGGGVGADVVGLYARLPGLCALGLQPAVHSTAKAAELLVLAIAQGQQAVLQLGQGQGAGQNAAVEQEGVIWRIPLAIGAEDEERPFGRL